MSHPLPRSLPHRLECVGKALYGERWRDPVARAIGVSRSSIHLWMKGHHPRRDIDVDALLLDLVRRRGLTPDQVGPVVALEKKLAAFIEEKA